MIDVFLLNQKLITNFEFMKKPTLTYTLALLLNLIGYSTSFYFIGWKFTIIVFLLIWANNAERTYRGK